LRSRRCKPRQQERPELVEPHRRGEDDAGHRRDAQLEGEGLSQAARVEHHGAPLCGELAPEGVDQELEQRLVVDEADNRTRDDRTDRLDHPRTQLAQVFDERHVPAVVAGTSAPSEAATPEHVSQRACAPVGSRGGRGAQTSSARRSRATPPRAVVDDRPVRAAVLTDDPVLADDPLLTADPVLTDDPVGRDWLDRSGRVGA
jgi:hypothetical protein